MSPVWKLLLALALVLPVGAYVAGSLAASSADEPAPRDPIVITEPRPSSTPTSGAPSPTATPTSPSDDASDDDSDDDSDDVEIVNPEPGEVEDNSGRGNSDDRDDDDRDDGDDDRDDRDDDDRGDGDDDD